ncbi:TIGR00341 family protein [Bacillaceae bacterium W0354]
MQLVEVYLPKKLYHIVEGKLKQFSRKGTWKEDERENRLLIRLIISEDQVEEVLNYLEQVSRMNDEVETMLFPVHTYFSKETIEEDEQKAKEKNRNDEEKHKFIRMSRQELTHEVEEKSELTINYVLLVIFSSIVASAGFMKDSEAIVIGAMVIAPLIGPAISMSFASVLGNVKHLKKATITLVTGFAIIVGIAIIFGLLFDEVIESSQYLSRTNVTIADFFLALAAGSAGSLSILNRLQGSLVGVMVAVALLPPVITFGVSIGKQLWLDTYNSFLLVMTNVTCILLSGIIIFIASGIRPVRWKSEQHVQVSSRLSILFVSVIAGVLLFIILFAI